MTLVLSDDELRVLRVQLVDTAKTLAHLANTEDPTESARGVIRQLQSLIAPFEVQREGLRSPEQRFAETTQRLEERERKPMFPGYPVRLDVINTKLMGLRPQSLVTIGARPRIGKTSLGYQLAEEVAEQDRKPCWAIYFTPEQSDLELCDRSIIGYSQIQSRKVLVGAGLSAAEREVLRRGAKRLSRLRLWTYDYSVLDCEGIEVVMNQVVTAKDDDFPLGVIFVDHLQRMRRLPGMKEHESLAAHVRGLKTIAKTHNLCVVLLSQFNRLDRGQKPRLEDFRYTADIDSESDTCLALHRDEDASTVIEQPRVSTDFYALKHRHGACFWTTLDFVRNDTRFEMSVSPQEVLAP